MARNRKTGKNTQKKRTDTRLDEAKLLRHIARLDLRTKEAYKRWCKEHGFSCTFVKTEQQQLRERQKHAELRADARLSQHSRESKLRQQIAKIYDQEVSFAELGNDLLMEIFNGFKRCKNPRILLDTLLYLERRSKLLTDPNIIRGIVALVSNHACWIRPLTHWRGQKHSAHRQFASLVRHLLTQYDVPEFMDSVWTSGKRRHQAWFIHIGRGHNIRSAEALPVQLTKKMAHHFLQAPPHYSVLAAFRWAQVISVGGSASLCDAIAATQLGRRFRDDAFWMSVIRFFVANPMLAHIHVHPIIDYIWNQKYEDQYEYEATGRARNIGPAQPNFTMRGRTGESLLAQVDGWHRRLGRVSHHAGDRYWHRWRIGDYQFIEGSSAAGTRRIWTIRELLSSKELVAEGRTLKHCVASYAVSCSSGTSAIYTMHVYDRDGDRKLLTIEVNRKHLELAQVRGKRNRLPTGAEASVLQRWTQKHGLKWNNGLN